MKTTEKKDFNTMVMEKKALLDVLEDLMERINYLDDNARLEWRSTGKQEQATRWDRETDTERLVWKDADGKRTFDETITGEPYMVDVCDNLPKLDYSDRDLARLHAIELVRNTLADLA